MKLYVFPVAPNPTRVRLYLAEKREAGGRLSVEELQLNLPKGEQHTPEHLARNPSGKLPVLELDDGSHLCESLAIIEFLEELEPETPLIGSDPCARAHVLEALDAKLADGRPFLAGERVSVADCTLAAALQFGRFGGVEIDPRHQQLARWDRDYRARPAARSVLSL